MSESDASPGRVDRVMLDLETLGLEPGAAILSIGAVRFSKDGLGGEFHRNVSLQSCDDAGLEIDVGTLEWWLGQDDEVSGILTGGEDLSRVLFEFGNFYRGADEIWAFSPSFDCEILASGYDAIGETKPWSYQDERCCRTLAALPIAADVEREGNEHDALDDAKYQARTAAETLRRLEENDE